jgi:hypothetical protein
MRELNITQQELIVDINATSAKMEKIRAGQEVKATTRAGQERTEASQECNLEAKIEANRGENTETAVSTGQERMEAGHEEMRIPINYNQEEMRPAVFAIRSAQAEFEETISKRLESILASVDKRLQSSCGQLHSQTRKVKALVETTRLEQKSQLTGVETPVRRGRNRNALTCVALETLKWPIHDQSCCATLRVVQLGDGVWC